jgi:hypothetical protein
LRSFVVGVIVGGLFKGVVVFGGGFGEFGFGFGVCVFVVGLWVLVGGVVVVGVGGGVCCFGFVFRFVGGVAGGTD